jgi:2-methylisocitrate lyase-like PEP mutase family enzyme
MATSVSEKRAAFRDLHQSGCFTLPNPWDIGSAKYLQSLGFKALASTSAGFAWAIGKSDNRVTREDVLGHLTELCQATDLPVNADFEGGFAQDPMGVAQSVSLAVGTGVAGLSIEDRSSDAGDPLYDHALAVERIKAAREAIDVIDPSVMLVARCEGFLVGRDDLDFVVKRMVAFAEAGADCLYAPGLATPEQITVLVRAVAPKPVNILLGFGSLGVNDLAALGVRRVSVGGALARAAWGGFARAAQELAAHGTLTIPEGSIGGRDINALMG